MLSQNFNDFALKHFHICQIPHSPTPPIIARLPLSPPFQALEKGGGEEGEDGIMGWAFKGRESDVRACNAR